jgi:hypothetical protein
LSGLVLALPGFSSLDSPEFALKYLLDKDRRFDVDVIRVDRTNSDKGWPTADERGCMMGRDAGADVLIWRDTRVTTVEATCEEFGSVLGVLRCKRWSGNHVVDADIAYHVMDIATCETRTVLALHGHGEAQPWRKAVSHANARAGNDLFDQIKRSYRDAFSADLRVARTDGTTGTIRRSLLRAGDTLEVIRDGAQVGHVVVTEESGDDVSVQAFTGNVELREQDRLEPKDRWCCLELALGAAMRTAEVDGSSSLAPGGAVALRWYAARSSPIFSLEIERLATDLTPVHLISASGGYRRWIVPRNLAAIGVIGGGVAQATIPDPDAVDDRLAAGVLFGYARLGAQLRVLDFLWMHLAGEVSTGPSLSEWYEARDVMQPGPSLELSSVGLRLDVSLRY